MSEAYAAAGVDTDEADKAVAAIVGELKAAKPDGGSRVVPLPGHYASVLKIAPGLGLAIATDGVGSKLVVAEQTGRIDTVGIDCVAMNVNDLVCVGAEPIAMVDYIAVEQSDPERLGLIAKGIAEGARQANIEVPGGEVAVLPELIKGHPTPTGFDLCGAAVGTVALDKIITGDKIAAGDALVGVPSSGLHSNGYTLARRALLEQGGLALDATPEELGGASVVDALLEPTLIYVRAALALIESDEVDIHGLAHITGGGVANLLRLGQDVGYAIDAPLPVPGIFPLIQRLGNVTEREMWEVFNMGCGFVATVPAEQAERAAEILGEFHPGTAVIGQVTADAGAATVRGQSILG
ncbi:MAG: phosphoribosylformylglycinamidine cyclo-ligase [Solirubrobacteraceae bacterium]|nr:phosphoribosylformylglycinamidine cyclo-ligase [Solirubrobacteraceae bacterium]